MGQQSLIYSFVARGTVILSEYTDFNGNFTSVAAECLQKLPATNNKFTYNTDGHTFNYLVNDGFTYCVVAVESIGKQVPMAFLERIKEDFTKKYSTTANSLNKEFGSKLKEQMQYCADHPEEISKLAKVKAQVSEVKGVMEQNINNVLDRGVQIEVLVDKTEKLRDGAQDFRRGGDQLRRKMWMQNMKIKLIVLGIIIALILIIVLSACGGFNCGKDLWNKPKYVQSGVKMNEISCLKVPMAFLERIKEDFTKKYSSGKAATATANSLNKEFGSKLKEQMQYCADHPEEISKLAKVKAQVSEVKGVMEQNINNVLDRGVQIEVLVDKTEKLRDGAQDFRRGGDQLRRKMWMQNMKIKLIVLGIIIALILIIVLSACGGFNCGK
nr:vesicle-associated membrane protein 722-like [Tanacetum cinerariifolium]